MPKLLKMIVEIKKQLELPCGYVIENRIAKASLTEHLADQDYNPNDGHFRLYRKWSKSGAGINLTGNVMIDRNDVEGEGNVVIDNYDQLPLLKEWVKAGGSNLWLQIGHAGALSNSKRPLSPSGVTYTGKRKFKQSYEVSLDDIKDVKRRFGLVSKLAKDVGFAGIEIHSAHGFLLNQFLSPDTNKRADSYGGSFENRIRLLLEVVDTVRKKVGESYPVAVKINSDEEDSLRLCLELDKAGVDLIELSGGNYENPVMLGKDKPQEYFRDFSISIKQSGVKCPILLTGGIRSIKSMEEIVSQGVSDMIGLGRPMILDPELPKKLLSGKLTQIDPIDEDNLEVMEQLNYYWSRLSALSK